MARIEFCKHGMGKQDCALCAIAALEAQRDELAAALRSYLEDYPSCAACFPCDYEHGNCKCGCHKINTAAEAALAKVPKKGG